MTLPKLRTCGDPNCAPGVYEYDSGSRRAECDRSPTCWRTSGCHGNQRDAIRDWNKRADEWREQARAAALDATGGRDGGE